MNAPGARGALLIARSLAGLILLVTLGVTATPDGWRQGVLVFGANHGGNWNLCMWNSRGELVQLTSSRLDARTPSIAPDSSRVAYTTSDGGLWLVDLKSRVTQKLAARFSNGSYGYPAWVTKDLLAYTVYTVTPPTEDSDIYAYSFSEGKQRILVRQTGSQDYANVSPDGQQVAYMSSVTTTVSGLGTTITQQLWIASLRTGKVEQLIPGGSRDTRPAWSPDGKKIAFSSDREGGPDVWVVEVDTKKLAKVTSGPGEKTDPCWSPDGRQILFVSTASGRRELEIVELESGHTKQVRPFGNKNVEIRDPAWSR